MPRKHEDPDHLLWWAFVCLVTGLSLAWVLGWVAV